jgi:RNA polymerase sigma-70 factor, ECF subfamily
MERIHRGDVSALDELLRRFWRPLVSYARRIVPEEAAEDVVQEALLRVWKDRGRWTPTPQLQAFLYRVTRNQALNENRARGSRARWVEAKARESQESVRTPLQNLEEQELQSLVAEALDQLPPKRREVFVLIRYHGLSYKEAAGVLDIAPQTVANHVSGALATLRKFLEPRLREFGYPAPDPGA